MLRHIFILTLCTITFAACVPQDAPLNHPEHPQQHPPRGRDTPGVMTLDHETLLPLALSVPSALIAAGITQIGALDLTQLTAQLKGISWYFFELGYPAGSEGTRTAAIYYADSKEVFVGRMPWHQFEPALRPALLLHEGLGASGYDDVHYGLSAALTFLAGMQGDSAKLREALATPAIREFFGAPPAEGAPSRILLAEGGSGTGVGGGGDEIGVYSKFIMLTLAHEAAHRGLLGDAADPVVAKADYDRLLRLILRISIEPDRDQTMWAPMEGKNPFTVARTAEGGEKVGIPLFAWRMYEDGRNDQGLLRDMLLPLFRCLAAEAGVALRRAEQ